MKRIVRHIYVMHSHLNGNYKTVEAVEDSVVMEAEATVVVAVIAATSNQTIQI